MWLCRSHNLNTQATSQCGTRLGICGGLHITMSPWTARPRPGTRLQLRLCRSSRTKRWSFKTCMSISRAVTTRLVEVSTTGSPLGQQPLAPAGYKFYRDVVKDYNHKADNTGKTDASEAINAAIQDGSRCGKTCSSTFTLGAIVYFPPGTYKICSPIIQLYYTQFIGDAIDVPTIKGCNTFKGIALFDTDPYNPGGYVETTIC